MEQKINQWSRSEHMKMLHAQGRYAGTSKIGAWNVSDEKRQRMAAMREANALDKSSHGYGSEYHMREVNRELLHNKFQGESGYMYFLEFPGSVKIGFSKDWERRTTKQILGGRVLMIIAGPTPDLADLEFDTLLKFQRWTKLDETGTRYTEYIDRSQKAAIRRFLQEAVRKNKALEVLLCM